MVVLRPASKLAALAVVAALLVQPLLAVPLCWQGSTTSATCPGGCPPTEQSSNPSPIKARPGVPACCEISSSEPVLWATVAKGPQTTRTPLVAPATPRMASVEVLRAPVPVGFISPPAVGSSLHTLYCVFLI